MNVRLAEFMIFLVKYLNHLRQRKKSLQTGLSCLKNVYGKTGALGLSLPFPERLTYLGIGKDM